MVACIAMAARSETLYDALGAPPDAPGGQLRKLAHALRRDPLTHDSDVPRVCLAEEVLVEPTLRAEYDALLARAAAANIPLPHIGPACEGSRLGPSAATRIGASLRGLGQVFKGVLMVSLAIGALVAVAILLGNAKSSRYTPTKIEIPRFAPPVIDYAKLIESYPIKPVEVPKLELDLEPLKLDLSPEKRPVKKPRPRKKSQTPPPEDRKTPADS